MKSNVLLTMLMFCFLFGCHNVKEDKIEVDWNEVDDVIMQSKLEERTASWIYESTARDHRKCTKSDWKKSRGETDTLLYGTFYVIQHKNKEGYWHNPEGDFARTFYTYSDEAFIQVSYNNQISEDVVQKIKGVETRYPASIRLRDSAFVIVHKQNTWETDIETKNGIIPAVIKLNAFDLTDTICIGHYECDRYISGCRYF